MEIAKFQNAAAALRSGLQGDMSANPIQIKLSKNAHTLTSLGKGGYEDIGEPEGGAGLTAGVAVCLHKNMQM